MWEHRRRQSQYLFLYGIILTSQRGEDARMSRKILDLAREQQEEVSRELGDDDEWEDEEEPEASARARVGGMGVASDDEEDGDEFEDGDVSGGEEEAELEIDPEDHATLDALGSGAQQQQAGKTLADLIFAKMEGGAQPEVEDDGPPDPRQGLNPKVVEVYTK